MQPQIVCPELLIAQVYKENGSLGCKELLFFHIAWCRRLLLIKRRPGPIQLFRFRTEVNGHPTTEMVFRENGTS